MAIAMFCAGKSTTLFCCNLCFSVLEVYQVFFRVYHMWCGTRIRDKYFSVVLLVLFFMINCWYYIKSSVTLFADYFSTFSSCRNTFLCDCSFFDNFISSCYLCSCFCFIFLPRLYSGSISWRVWVCCSNDILVHVHCLFESSIFLCAHISRKPCRYPCIGTLRKGVFHVLLKLLVFIVH